MPMLHHTTSIWGGANPCTAKRWLNWDELTEDALACEHIVIWMMENAAAGGSETGQGGGYSETELTAPAVGSLAGAVAGFRHFTNTTTLQLNTQVLSDLIGNVENTFSLLVKVRDVPLLYGNVLHWGDTTVNAGMQVDTTVSTRYPIFWAGGAGTPSWSGAGVPATGEVWLAWWSDGMTLRSGWCGTRPLNLSDFGANVATYPNSPALFVGMEMNYSYSGKLFGDWSCNGDVGCVVAASLCLIDNNA